MTRAASFLSRNLPPYCDRRSKRLNQHLQSQSVELPAITKRYPSVYGLLIGLTIIGLWVGSLIFCLSLDLFQLHPVWILLLFLWQTFLYTGLFITAHDAMHGAVFPANRRLNDAIGAIAVFLYALFDYRKLLKSHWQHHQHPASDLDPDFHHLRQENLWGWYLQFMQSYSGWVQVIGLTAIFHVVTLLLPVSRLNMGLFWGLPALLSSLQLFYFGTFLPHRQPQGGYRNPYRAESTPLPILWSFLTCYHFGYHYEHHAYPDLAWWQLPQAFRLNRQRGLANPARELPLQ